MTLLFLMKEELMRRTHLLKVLIAILLVVGLLTPSAATVRLKEQTAQFQPQVTTLVEKKSVVKIWQQVIEFAGSSIKTTQKSTIDSDEWMLTWTTTLRDYEGNFVIYVYSGNGDIVNVVANLEVTPCQPRSCSMATWLSLGCTRSIQSLRSSGQCQRPSAICSLPICW